MKAFCLAIAFLLAPLPAIANELPQTGNALRATEPDMAEPGSYQWTVLDDNANEAPASAATRAVQGHQKNAPALAALAQVRAETARLLAEARRTSTRIDKIRYDMKLTCVVERIDTDADPLANAKMPWIWGSSDKAEADSTGMFEMCDIDYSRKVRSESEPQPEQPELVDYTVYVPVGQ